MDQYHLLVRPPSISVLHVHIDMYKCLPQTANGITWDHSDYDDLEYADPPEKSTRARLEALKRLEDVQNVFVLDAYLLEQFVLQLKVSKGDTLTFSVNTSPWSMLTGGPVTDDEFRRGISNPKKADSVQVKILRDRRNADLRISDLVRFILTNSDCTPTIISNNFTRLMGNKMGRFVGHFVCNRSLTGPQICSYYGCINVATAAAVDSMRNPETIYCSQHAFAPELENHSIMLYNPLLVDFEIRESDVLLSALNIQDVFALTIGDSHTAPQTSPTSLPLQHIWTPICKRPKFYESTGSVTERLFEMARGVLTCYEDHFRRGRHFYGVDIRHSLTVCLLKAFLKERRQNKLCGLSVGWEDLE